MRITITDKQRVELLDILKLLESDSFENNILAFSLLESNFEFLNQYAIIARHVLDGPYFIEDTSFSGIVKTHWIYAAKVFLQNIIAGSHNFKLVV